MADLTAPCDWRGDELHIILPELPKRIAVTLPDERGREVYSARVYVYVAEADVPPREEREAENAMLRELLQEAVDAASMRDITDWPYGQRLGLIERARELGVEPENDA